MKISKTDTIMGGGKFELPKGCYRARVTGTSFGKSNSGNPMTTLNAEIVEPESITIDGADQRIAGMSFKLYLVHVPSLVGKQTESSQSQVFRFMDKLKVEYDGEEYDTDAHAEYFLGMEFDIILSSEEAIKRLPADKSKGEKIGAPILDGEGKEISDGWRINANISDVLENCRPSRAEVPY